jgi:hypothetical protein
LDPLDWFFRLTMAQISKSGSAIGWLGTRSFANFERHLSSGTSWKMTAARDFHAP